MAPYCPLISDVKYEILNRVPLQTLDTCKAVSKEFKSITSETNFKLSYFKRTDNVCGYFVQGLKSHHYLSEFVSVTGDHHPPPPPSLSSQDFPLNLQIVASSDQGILCCVQRGKSGRKPDRYYVCKPTTKQWRAVPNPKTRFRTEAVGLMVLGVNPLRYKIIRISEPKTWPPGKAHFRVEIFESQEWAWRQSHDIFLPQRCFLKLDPAIFAGGSLYWLTSDYKVLVFHEESFTTIPLPESAVGEDRERYQCEHRRIVEYQGKLGLIHMVGDDFVELWSLNNNPAATAQSYCWWKKEKVLSLKSNLNRGVIWGVFNGDVAVMKGFNEVVFHNPKDKKSVVMKLHQLNFSCEMFPYRSDLKPVDLSAR